MIGLSTFNTSYQVEATCPGFLAQAVGQGTSTPRCIGEQAHLVGWEQPKGSLTGTCQEALKRGWGASQAVWNSLGPIMGSVSLDAAGRSRSPGVFGRDLCREPNPSPRVPSHQLARNMNKGTEQHMNATETVPGHGSEDGAFRSKQPLKLNLLHC